MLRSFLALLYGAGNLYGAISAFTTQKKIKDLLSLQKTFAGRFDEFDKQFKFLNDNILLLNRYIVKDITREKQVSIDNLEAISRSLKPIQDFFMQPVVGSKLIITPDRMQRAMMNPREVLVEVRDLSDLQPPNEPDMVPIVFYDSGLCVGFQKRLLIPKIFDCSYEPELWSLEYPDEKTDKLVISSDHDISMPSRLIFPNLKFIQSFSPKIEVPVISERKDILPEIKSEFQPRHSEKIIGSPLRTLFDYIIVGFGFGFTLGFFIDIIRYGIIGIFWLETLEEAIPLFMGTGILLGPIIGFICFLYNRN